MVSPFITLSVGIIITFYTTRHLLLIYRIRVIIIGFFYTTLLFLVRKFAIFLGNVKKKSKRLIFLYFIYIPCTLMSFFMTIHLTLTNRRFVTVAKKIKI